MNPEERNELVEEYGRGFDLFSAALAGLPRQAWEFKPAVHEWSIHELIVHMADSECMGALRVRKLIAEPGGTLMTYDDAIWAEALGYQNQNVDDALQLFKLTRQTTYDVLKTTSNAVFTHSVVHPQAVYPEYGELFTLEKWLQIYTRHIRDHIGQLRKTYEAWQEQND